VPTFDSYLQSNIGTEGSVNGNLSMDVPIDATIPDLAGNLFASLPYMTGEAYTVTRVYNLFLPLNGT
jgi:hypothetical protein